MTTEDDGPDYPGVGDGTMDHTVGMLMGDEIVSAPATTTFREAAKMLHDAEVGLLVIGEPTSVKGVVSERDIVRAVARGVDLDAATVTDSLSTNLKWATPDTSVGNVIEEMMEGYLRHVLVGGDGGELVGIVSMRDLLAAFPGPD